VINLAKCRFCNTKLKNTFVDLGMSPLANSYLKKEQLNKKENFYPLNAYVCSNCYLVQLEEFESPKEIFNEYAYFSSYSDSWLRHAKIYSEKVIERFNINSKSKVIEIASNDGYLLQYFKKENIPVLGIEPAKNVALEAEKKGISTIKEFFNCELVEEILKQNIKADLLIGNNVLAHVPNINDFVKAMKLILKSNGIITMEFPHLLQLINENQFDTIYHEHFSYLSLIAVNNIFQKHGLCIFDVEELNTHGGSLRIYAKHMEDTSKDIHQNVAIIVEKEIKLGLNEVEAYTEFHEKVKKIKRNSLQHLIKLKNKGYKIVGYGAPAKGNTFLNYCGIGSDFLEYTVDKNPYKQELCLPGTHIPIYPVEKIKETKPDYVVILPWNIKEEVIEQIKYIREWNGNFITFIPQIEVF